MNICRWFLILVLLLPALSLCSQEIQITESKSNARNLADSLFNAGDFAKALPIFSDLYNNFPKDNYYNYALGVCYLNSTRDAKVAIPFLSKASTGEVPNMVYFYLAEACRKTYQFDKAIEFYRRFTINGGSKDIKTGDIEKLVNLCEDGNSMLKYIYSPLIIDKKKVSASDFNEFYSLSVGGSFIKKPDNLKSLVDQNRNEQSIIFYPKSPKAGDYIYYSSYGKSTLYGKDIYRVKRQEDGSWGKSENLGEVINSSEDEDFPYITANGSVLYFASKGHYSMGGYDIYRSVFDANANKWGSPENLGFPFSSPFDDLLYAPDLTDSIACFATNRNCNGDSVEVVMYRVDKDPIRHSFTSVEEVQGIAMLNPTKEKGGKGSNVQQDELQTGESGPVVVAKSKTKSASFNAVENDPEYIRVITNGFSKQKETDSLRVKLEKLRGGFDYVTTAEERKSLEAKVVKVENALLSSQSEADKMFARASQIEQEYLTGVRVAEGSVNNSFATDNPEYLYQAQFASTVFRSDEITKLSQVEKLQNQINSAREEAISAKAKYEGCTASNDSTLDCNVLRDEMNKKMDGYSNLIAKWYDAKYKIYSDCLLIAIVKSGNNNGDEARAELDRADSHFRAASAIKNNLTDEGRFESLYEASLLNEIGILRLEIAFARTWGMNLFQQQATSKAIRLEKIAFGNPLPSVAMKVDKEEKEQKIETKQVGITRVQLVNNEPILIKKDEPIAFQVLEQSPYDAQTPIPVNEPYPSGVIYKIQLGAYSKPLDISSFKGMAPISVDKPSGASASKYFAGRFKRFADAEKALPVVRSKGFKDAFIVAWLNGKSIPVARAQSMEGSQPEVSDTSHSIQKNEDSTSVKDKIFVVQIGKYSNRLPDDIYQTVKAMASGKDIIRKPDERGQMVYSIGNFLTLDEATRVKDNLIASGISGATVIVMEIEKK